MKHPVRFTDYFGWPDGTKLERQGDAVIDAAAIIGVSREIVGGKPYTLIEYGTDHCIRVREPLDEVLWKLGILA